MTDLPTFADVESAAAQIRGHAFVTPLIRNDLLDARVGGRVFIKAEALQRTGAFKFRGAYNRISRLSEEETRRGVVAYSSGNHAQAVAFAARLVGAPAVIVMPADAPRVKVDQTRDYGAEVVLYDRVKESREAIGEAIARDRGLTLVRPFDDPFVIAGQGTAGMEIASQLAEYEQRADLLLCPASGGGLIAGIGLALEQLSPETQIWAVEPQGYDDTRQSLEAGRQITVTPPGPSLQDALLTPTPGDLTFAINRRRLAGAVSVSDDQALDAVAYAFRYLKLVLEPGGASALAALLTGAVTLDGRTAVVVASGGNVDPEIFTRALGRLA